MCRVIFELDQLVRPSPCPCDIDEETLAAALLVVESLTAWRFVALERCVFSTTRGEPDEEAVSEVV